MLFIWAKRSKVYHRKDNVVERCNSDDIRKPIEGDFTPGGKRPCRWCQP